MASVYDLTMDRGSNRPIAWRFKVSNGDLFNLAGSVIALKITFRGGEISKLTGVDSNFVLDVSAATVTWTPSFAESRLIRPGRVSRYELERRAGGFEDVFLTGHITGIGGENDD